jgi:hypothetical protein
LIESFFKDYGTLMVLGDHLEKYETAEQEQYALDDLYTLDDPHTGQITIHSFSDFIQQLSFLHDEISGNKAVLSSKFLRKTCTKLF